MLPIERELARVGHLQREFVARPQFDCAEGDDVALARQRRRPPLPGILQRGDDLQLLQHLLLLHPRPVQFSQLSCAPDYLSHNLVASQAHLQCLCPRYKGVDGMGTHNQFTV